MTFITQIGEEVGKNTIAKVTVAILGSIGWRAKPYLYANKIRTLIANPKRKFDLYYRGNEKKRISFKEDGSIGDGQNNNEHRWKVRRGHLEIYAKNGDIYSKFRWDKDTGKLLHVNDPKLPSVMGQHIDPLFIPPDSSNTDVSYTQSERR